MQTQLIKTAGNKFAPFPPLYDAAGLTAEEFAELLFKFEYCAECHGDAKDHTFVVGPFGLWFAMCDYAEVD